MLMSLWHSLGQGSYNSKSNNTFCLLFLKEMRAALHFITITLFTVWCLLPEEQCCNLILENKSVSDVWRKIIEFENKVTRTTPVIRTYAVGVEQFSPQYINSFPFLSWVTMYFMFKDSWSHCVVSDNSINSERLSRFCMLMLKSRMVDLLTHKIHTWHFYCLAK